MYANFILLEIITFQVYNVGKNDKIGTSQILQFFFIHFHNISFNNSFFQVSLYIRTTPSFDRPLKKMYVDVHNISIVNGLIMQNNCELFSF